MRQYKSLIIVMFFLCIFALSKINAMVNGYTLLGKTIYLDAGHPAHFLTQYIENDYKYL